MTKKASINPQNTKDNYCFAYSIIGALNNEDISHHPEISNLGPYISNYNGKDINFPAEKKDWKTSERNNEDIAVNMLSAFSIEKISIIRRSEYNRKRKKQVDLLMITDNQNNWHYITI